MSDEIAVCAIPPNEWDTLELVAEAYGGIGRSRWLNGLGEPVCIIGACAFAGIPGYHVDPSAAPTMRWRGFSWAEIDGVQLRVALRLRADGDVPERVPFPDLMQELGAVRG